MRIAVLKNRLLQMSDRKFDERKHGAHSFREMLGQYPHILRIDSADVELSAGKKMPDAKQRVRADLWRAVMDYSSGRRYAWDTVQQCARPAEAGDTLIIPTYHGRIWPIGERSSPTRIPAITRWRLGGPKRCRRRRSHSCCRIRGPHSCEIMWSDG